MSIFQYRTRQKYYEKLIKSIIRFMNNNIFDNCNWSVTSAKILIYMHYSNKLLIVIIERYPLIFHIEIKFPEISISII